jgi:hypothetical protein
MRPGVGQPLRPRLVTVALSDQQWKVIIRLLSEHDTKEMRDAKRTIVRQVDRKRWATVEEREGD